MKTIMALALFCYFLAMLKFFLHLALQRRFFHVLAVLISALGFVLHTVMLFEISAKTGHGPYTNPQEYASFFAWTTTALMLIFIVVFRQAAIGVFVAPIAFLLMAYSILLPDTTGAPGPTIKAFWLTLHQTVSFLALSSFIVVFAASSMYVMQEKLIKNHNIGALFRRMPDLDTLDNILHRALLFGFPLITVGVASGIEWTYSKFGTWLGPQPLKVLPIIVVWLVYAFLMFGRTFVGWRGHKLAVMGIAGFALAVAGLAIHLL